MSKDNLESLNEAELMRIAHDFDERSRADDYDDPEGLGFTVNFDPDGARLLADYVSTHGVLVPESSRGSPMPDEAVFATEAVFTGKRDVYVPRAQKRGAQKIDEPFPDWSEVDKSDPVSVYHYVADGLRRKKLSVDSPEIAEGVDLLWKAKNLHPMSCAYLMTELVHKNAAPEIIQKAFDSFYDSCVEQIDKFPNTRNGISNEYGAHYNALAHALHYERDDIVDILKERMHPNILASVFRLAVRYEDDSLIAEMAEQIKKSDSGGAKLELLNFAIDSGNRVLEDEIVQAFQEDNMSPKLQAARNLVFAAVRQDSVDGFHEYMRKAVSLCDNTSWHDTLGWALHMNIGNAFRTALENPSQEVGREIALQLYSTYRISLSPRVMGSIMRSVKGYEEGDGTDIHVGL